MTNLSRALLTFILLALSSAYAVADNTVIINGTFGVQETVASIPISDQSGHAWVQQKRVDPLQSTDSRFDGATQILHEQLDTFPTYGTFRIYSEIKTSTGSVFTFFEGPYTVGQGTVPFYAKGKVLSGTGDFAGAKGIVQVEGDGAAGTYTVRLVLAGQ